MLLVCVWQAASVSHLLLDYLLSTHHSIQAKPSDKCACQHAASLLPLLQELPFMQNTRMLSETCSGFMPQGCTLDAPLRGPL